MACGDTSFVYTRGGWIVPLPVDWTECVPSGLGSCSVLEGAHLKRCLSAGGQAALAAGLVGDNICKPQHPTHIYMHMGRQDHPQGTDSLVTTPSHQLSQKALDFFNT